MPHSREAYAIGRLVVLVCGMSLACSAQSASTLMTRFAGLLGANNFCKLAWQEGSGAYDCGYDAAPTGTCKILTMDSKDGVVTTFQGTGYNTMPCITWDGLKVVWTMPITSEVYVADFPSAANKVKILTGYRAHSCWRSGTTNYVIATKMADGYNYRIDISNPATQQKLYTPGARNGACGNEWTSMSTDGKYMVGGFPEIEYLMFLTMSSSDLSTGSSASLNPNGCWPSIARDGTGDVLTQFGQHTELALIIRGGTTTNINTRTAGGGSPAISSGAQYNFTRWSNNRTYFTITDEGSEGDGGKGRANPRICNITTKAWVALYDAAPAGDVCADMYWYTTVGVAPRPALVTGPALSRSAAGQRIFDCRGALVNTRVSSGEGVFIVQAERGVKAVRGNGIGRDQDN